MVKRKFSAKEKRERKRYKKNFYNDEKLYWKNASARATREQKGQIEKLFAGAAGASSASSAVSAFRAVQQFAPAVETMFAGEGLGSAITLGAGLGSVGAVAGAAGLGYLAGSLISSLFTQTNSEQVGKLMPGTYQGKIGLSAGTAFKGLRDKYQKKGAVFIIENYGSIADPDLVFIGHSSWNTGCVGFSISYAIIRKLFRIGCKLDMKTPYEELPLINTVPDSGPNGFTIVYNTRDSDGTNNTYTHNIPNDYDINAIVNHNEAGFMLFDNIVESLTQQNPKVLQNIFLYQKNKDDTEARLQYRMEMGKEVLSVAMSSHIVIQNRTKSSAGSTDTLQVDAQPLKGPVFEFGSGVPHIKDDTPIELNQMIDSGLILVRNGQFSADDQTAYKEPLVRKSFQNVTKSAYTRLNPGALKSMTIGHDCRGYFHKVLFKMRVNDQNARVKQCYGKSQLAMFEEELNSGSANNLTITYECQHIAGADLTTTYNPVMAPGYAVGEVNNLPA